MKSQRLTRFVTDLMGRSDRQLADILARQIEAAIDGASLARAMANGEVSASAARATMAAIEHQGDDERARLVEVLSTTLTTPIDREDLFRLSRCVDDVLDGVRDFVRESDLYGLDRQSNVAPVFDALVEGLAALQGATQEMLQSGTAAALTTLSVRKAAGRIRQCYQLELAELFRGSLDMRTLKRRELLRRLDIVGLRLGEAADALADGIMKRGR